MDIGSWRCIATEAVQGPSLEHLSRRAEKRSAFRRIWRIRSASVNSRRSIPPIRFAVNYSHIRQKALRFSALRTRSVLMASSFAKSGRVNINHRTR